MLTYWQKTHLKTPLIYLQHCHVDEYGSARKHMDMCGARWISDIIGHAWCARRTFHAYHSALMPFLTQTKSSKALTAFSNYYDVKKV